MILRLTTLLALASILSSCGVAHTPERLADLTTRALYEDNHDAAVANFDERLKLRVTREQVGAISDQMHSLGRYKGLSTLHADDPGRFRYKANFDRGTMIVMVMINPAGHIAAYRVKSAGRLQSE
ncbi:MAG TPA: hypothetical protein VGG22_15770 [Candidatus Baltobacteraceae bacterium]|jgi:hypothetical protein